MPTHDIREFLSADQGYGKIFLRADAGGALTLHSSTRYLKPDRGETIPAFLRRVAAVAAPGDDIELNCERGVIQIARITRPQAVARGF